MAFSINDFNATAKKGIYWSSIAKNIGISFNLYNFNNQNNDKQNYNVEIVIKKYENLLFSEKTIFELNKVIFILNNEEQKYWFNY